MSARNVGWSSKLFITKLHHVQHLSASLGSNSCTGVDEHLIHSRLFKRGFLRGHNFHLCCSEDGQERMLAHPEVALCVLHYEVYELEVGWSRSPLNVLQFLRWSAVLFCRVGCGPSGKRLRYSLAAAFALRPQSP
ncbi:hypothetical protein AVEN_53229-1 [Araneus ventricosus]|uniref:Uncharacterized protein n=1 Tax=Araneus ventricosus TaxID=182803 RepID=A0A4Y2A9M0_ARAVE|nr:hypothetical protein AVEN_53229-1 [Araneus ventricosus]